MATSYVLTHILTLVVGVGVGVTTAIGAVTYWPKHNLAEIALVDTNVEIGIDEDGNKTLCGSDGYVRSLPSPSNPNLSIIVKEVPAKTPADLPHLMPIKCTT